MPVWAKGRQFSPMVPSQSLPRDPRRAATQLRLANRSTWGTDALRQEVGVYWQDTDDLFNDSTTHTVTNSRTTGAQWQASGRPGAGALGWRTALSWAHSAMERDLLRTYAAGYWQTLWKLRLPAAAPFIFNALRSSSAFFVVAYRNRVIH